MFSFKKFCHGVHNKNRKDVVAFEFRDIFIPGRTSVLVGPYLAEPKYKASSCEKNHGNPIVIHET